MCIDYQNKSKVLPLTGGDLELTEGQCDYPGVGEEERRYECHDELPKEGLSEGEFTP